MTFFQTGVLIVFGALAVTAVLMFSGLIPGFRPPADSITGTLILWGTFPREDLNNYLASVKESYGTLFDIDYVQKNPDTIEREFVESMARGYPPDLVIMPSELIAGQQNKLIAISYEDFSLRDFQETFIDGALDINARMGGLVGIPIAVDPFVMYYNRDLYSNSKIASAPKIWEEFVTPQRNLTNSVTVTDDRNNIVQSAIAFGEYSNIRHTKEIISLLMIQAGNPIVFIDGAGIRVTLLETFNYGVNPAEAALNFFIQFSNPTKATYSWNSSLPEARTAFTSGKLATYFGYASEYRRLKEENPHLNIGVATVPQRTKLDNKTFGQIYSLVVPRSQKWQGAIQAAMAMTGERESALFSAGSGLPSARRSLLRVPLEDPSLAAIADSAIGTRGWLDPSPVETEKIFQRMVQSVISGTSDLARALDRANAEIILLFKNA